MEREIWKSQLRKEKNDSNSALNSSSLSTSLEIKMTLFIIQDQVQEAFWSHHLLFFKKQCLYTKAEHLAEANMRKPIWFSTVKPNSKIIFQRLKGMILIAEGLFELKEL